MVMETECGQCLSGDDVAMIRTCIHDRQEHQQFSGPAVEDPDSTGYHC